MRSVHVARIVMVAAMALLLTFLASVGYAWYTNTEAWNTFSALSAALSLALSVAGILLTMDASATDFSVVARAAIDVNQWWTDRNFYTAKLTIWVGPDEDVVLLKITVPGFDLSDIHYTDTSDNNAFHHPPPMRLPPEWTEALSPNKKLFSVVDAGYKNTYEFYLRPAGTPAKLSRTVPVPPIEARIDLSAKKHRPSHFTLRARSRTYS